MRNEPVLGEQECPLCGDRIETAVYSTGGIIQADCGCALDAEVVRQCDLVEEDNTTVVLDREEPAAWLQATQTLDLRGMR